MERCAEECQKVANNDVVCGSLRNIYKIDKASKFHSSGNRSTNSFPEDCHEHVKDTLKTFYDCDKKAKVANSDFGNRERSCARFLGATETKSQESLKNVSKSEDYPSNVNICTNELFTAPYTSHGISKEVHSSNIYLRNFPDRHIGAMEVVHDDARPTNDQNYYFMNRDLLVKNFDHECDKPVVYSKQVQPKCFGVSPDDESKHINPLSVVRVRSKSISNEPRHFDGVNVLERTGSLRTSEETCGSTCKSGELRHLAETSLQTVSPTSSGTCQHSHSTANKSIDKEGFLDVPVLPDFATSNSLNQVSYSNLNTPAGTSSQCTKMQAPTDNKNSSLSACNMTLPGPCKHSFSTRTKSTSDDGPCCRICHSVTDLETLVSPCLCTGSMKYVHESCLLNWLKSSVKTNCELCLHEVPVKKLVKPLREWRFLDEKPVAIIWLLSFLILLTLNILSVIKDSTRGCSSTTCIAFYVLGCTGAVLGVIFLWFWAKKSAVYFKKLLTLNQIWLLKQKYFNKTEKRAKTLAVNCNV